MFNFTTISALSFDSTYLSDECLIFETSFKSHDVFAINVTTVIGNTYWSRSHGKPYVSPLALRIQLGERNEDSIHRRFCVWKNTILYFFISYTYNIHMNSTSFYRAYYIKSND